jgi:hypothetical protein
MGLYHMSVKEFLREFVILFILVYVLSVVVSFLYTRIVHRIGSIDWSGTMRLGILFGIILPAMRLFAKNNFVRTNFGY